MSRVRNLVGRLARRMSQSQAVRRLRGLGGDENGAVAMIVAVLSVLLIAAAGLALDVGLYYVNSRQLRVATEAAALAAAMKPGDATNQATIYLTKNGYDASVIKSVEVGYYCANSVDYAAGSRFVSASNTSACPGSSVKNAVRLTTTKKSQRFLSAVLGGSSLIPNQTATASAARIDEAGLAVTSDLLTLTNGKITATLINSVNGLLDALLNISLKLNSDQIMAMMSHNVDAAKFLDALASRTSFTGTYSQLLAKTYAMQDVAEAAATAASDATTAATLRAIGTAASGYQVPMSNMFGLGVWKNRPVGEASVKPFLRAGVNAYQLIAYAAQAGPGTIDASEVVNLVTPGNANNIVKIVAVASGTPDRPRFSFGPAGETKVGTSMLRLQVVVQLANLDIAGIVNAKAEIPLVLDVAAAQAEIPQSGIDCAGQEDQSTQTAVTVSAKSGLVNLYLGTLNNTNAMTKSMPTLSDSDFTAAHLFQLRLLSILPVADLQAKAVVKPVLGESSNSIIFGRGGAGTIGTPDIAGKPVIVGNTFQLGNTLTALSNSLLANNSLKSCTLGLLCLTTASSTEFSKLKDVLNVVGTLLNNTADPLLDDVLGALGIELGHATVWVTGARCGVPVLI